VADLELLISRYLDGELSPAEHLRLQKILAGSPEARALLREMTALARAARRSPLLHQPPSHLESTLFARLREEGLHSPAVPKTTASPTPLRDRWFGSRTLRMAMAGVALFIGFIGDSYFVNRFPVRVSAPSVTSANAYASRIETDRGAVVAAPSLAMPSASGRRIAAPASHHDAAPIGPVHEHGAPDPQTPSISPQSAPRVSDPVAPIVPPSQEGTMARVNPRTSVDTFSIPIAPAERLASSMAMESLDAETGEPHLAASFRPGVAMIERRERAIARDVSLQLGMELKGGHQLSLIVGTSPSITETRHENTFEPLSSPAFASTPNEDVRTESEVTPHHQSIPLPEYELRLRNEAWVGVGYSYSVTPVKGMSVGIGVNAGASASAWRVGGELPVRYAVMKNIAIEGAVSVSGLNPRNHDVERFVVTDSPDHFLYRASIERPSFVSYGVQLGIRVDLAGNR
jgi:hypothetical protein